MGVLEEYRRIVRHKEYEEEEAKEKALTENAQTLYNGFKTDFDKRAQLVSQPVNELNLMKNVICECVTDLYIKSLVIDNKDKYETSLRTVCNEQCMDILSEADSLASLRGMFKNVSPYLKSVYVLAEDVCDAHNETEFKEEQILTPEDLKMIEDFRELEGEDNYASDIQDRVIDVYSSEQELGENQKEKVENMISTLSDVYKDKPMAESVGNAMNVYSNVPETVFGAIFMNKSKTAITESASIDRDMSELAEAIINETISTYTLLECIHSLGLKTFTDKDRSELRYQFFVG